MNQTTKVILAGGNGYIGGTTAFALKEAGFVPVILDNFSTSRRGLLKEFELVETELTDFSQVRRAFKQIGPAVGIIHFAAKALVPESFLIPSDYFRNNLVSTLNLAEVATDSQLPIFLHSSSCAVYGTPNKLPIPESSPLRASSPYGDTKIMAEVLLNRFHQMQKLKVVHLRYFNPAGAWKKYHWGESHDPETHLIPNVIAAALQDRPISLFGNQYPTPDGSCIRDFIHVVDLAEAHVKTLQLLLQGKTMPLCLNVGRGQGSSVLQVVQTAERVIGKTIRVVIKPPREGDPPELVADSTLMRDVLQWSPSRDLSQMIHDDWTWRSSVVK